MQNTKEILRKVRKVELKTRRAVETLMQGSYHSVFKGRGIEFSDVREYVPGDDIRAIDWNITARMNTPYLKEFIEERNLTIYIVFDVSASNEFGSLKEKKETIIELAASIMFAAIRNNDRVSLCLFTDDIELFIPPKSGKKHVLKLISEMISWKPRGKSTNLERVITKVGKIAKKRSVIFLMSDFISGDYEKPLAILNKKHDCIALNIRDIREEDIPDIGYIQLEDAETGEQLLVNTSDPAFRRNYLMLAGERGEATRRLFKKLKMDMVSLRSDQDFLTPIRRLFAMRERRQSR